MQYYNTKRYRHIWLRFRSLIILYATFFIFWFVLKVAPGLQVVIFEKWFHFESGFVKNWYPSFTEDIFFFGAGFLGLVITTKLLRDESFDIRVSSLANGENMTAEVDFVLKKEIEKLLSYNFEYNTTLEIQKIDQKKRNIFVHVEMDCKVLNMCEDQKIPAYLNAYVEPGKQIEGTYGQIYAHTITPGPSKLKYPFKNYTTPPNNIIKPGHIFELNNLNGDPYKQPVPFFIPENSYVTWKLCFGIWVPINSNYDKSKNWFFNAFSGYTEGFNLTLINSLARTVNYHYKYKSNLTKDQEIRSLSNIKIVSNLICQKDDKFEIFFYLAN